MRRNEGLLREDESVDVLKNIEDTEMLVVIGGVDDDISTLIHQMNPRRIIGQCDSVRARISARIDILPPSRGDVLEGSDEPRTGVTGADEVDSQSQCSSFLRCGSSLIT